MTSADLAFADALRGAVGWNQTVGDWNRFLELEPGGCFVATWHGEPAGTATTLVHGPNLAWIGMVLVQPEFRRQGIGKALLLHCIEHLRSRGIRCIKLDATPLGRPVYERIGFKPEWTLSRWEHPGSPTAPNPTDSWRPVQTDDLHPRSAVEELDATAFGTPRTRLLAALARQSRQAVVRQGVSGKVEGYGFLRPGALADYLGPAVATDPETSVAILRALFGGTRGRRIFWDIPEPNTHAVQWAEQHGFHRQRELTRMYLGENSHPGNPRRQLALSGPETG
ncbi:MAG: GNAT family N-acetyltransferase [Limisphaerales bacterium]